MFKKTVSFILGTALALSLVGCGGTASKSESTSTSTAAQTTAAQTSTASSSAGAKKLVAFSQGDNSNSWRATNTNDMEAWAKKSGYDYVWTDAKSDASKQLSDIETLLSQKPDVLIVAPVQEKAVAPAAELAKKAGVPLITIDREIEAELGQGTYVAKITQDWKEAGVIQAKYVAEKLKEKNGDYKGNIIEITGTIGASPSIDEAAGLREGLKDYPDIKIIDSQTGNYQRAPARAVMQDLLQKYPAGKIDAVVVFNDEMVIGALQSIKEADRNELLGYIAGKDGLKDGLKEVIDGNVMVDVQAPPYYGEVTMNLVAKLFNGDKLEPNQKVPFKIFDMKDNKQITTDYYDNLVKNNLSY